MSTEITIVNGNTVNVNSVEQSKKIEEIQVVNPVIPLSYMEKIDTLQIDKADITSLSYTHIQDIASEEWIVEHNLNRKVSITIVDSADTVVCGNVKYQDLNTTIVTFSGGFSGKAYCN